jgi:hypothetical protein
MYFRFFVRSDTVAPFDLTFRRLTIAYARGNLLTLAVAEARPGRDQLNDICTMIIT